MKPAWLAAPPWLIDRVPRPRLRRVAWCLRRSPTSPPSRKELGLLAAPGAVRPPSAPARQARIPQEPLRCPRSTHTRRQEWTRSTGTRSSPGRAVRGQPVPLPPSSSLQPSHRWFAHSAVENYAPWPETNRVPVSPDFAGARTSMRELSGTHRSWLDQLAEMQSQATVNGTRPASTERMLSRFWSLPQNAATPSLVSHGKNQFPLRVRARLRIARTSSVRGSRRAPAHVKLPRPPLVLSNPASFEVEGCPQ